MMTVSDLARKNITIGLVLFVIVGFITASIMAKKQDQAFQTDQELYKLVVQQLQEGNYGIVLAGTSTLEHSQRSSEAVNYTIGLAAANAGELEKGILHMQRALDINPHKVEDPMFMLQFAEALVLAGKNKEAGLVLERSKSFAAPESFPHYQERVTQLQEEIGDI